MRIVLRADSGFAREPLMAWCEDNGVDYVFGLARNERDAPRKPGAALRAFELANPELHFQPRFPTALGYACRRKAMPLRQDFM